jgi:hypothetical protein
MAKVRKRSKMAGLTLKYVKEHQVRFTSVSNLMIRGTHNDSCRVCYFKLQGDQPRLMWATTVFIIYS